MKRLLFILPGLATGGTNSSFDALYHHLKTSYDISVFAISHQPHNHQYSFETVLLPKNSFLSYAFSNYGSQQGFEKILSFFVKTIQSILLIFKFNITWLYAKRYIQKLEKSNNYDYVIGFQEGYSTRFTSLFNNLNKVCWVHCDYDKWMPKEKTELMLYSKFKTIVCVSEYTRNIFSKRYPPLANKTIAIHNLIDTERILELGNYSIEDSRYKSEGYVILSVGRFHPVKRFREIPAVASELKKSGLHFTWYVLGPGDNIELSAFNTNVDYYAVRDCVKWLGGKSNPYPYFKTADLYVCLSESEACPMVFLEAQLFNLPIITTDFPSSSEFIQSGNGVISSLKQIPSAIEVISKEREKQPLSHSTSHEKHITINKLRSIFN